MKKAVLAFMGIASLVYTLPYPISAQNPTDKIVVYTSDYQGGNLELGPGRYDYMYLVRAGVVAVKSVKVPPGLKVTLYERDNFEGGSVTLTDNTKQSHLEAKGFGQLSQNNSLIVEKIPIEARPAAGSYVTIYRDDFSGTSKNLVAGSYEFHDLGDVDNDQLSSVKVPTGLKVTLYEHGGFQGRSISFTADSRAAWLKSKNFNDITSSILVEQAIVPPVAPKEDIPVVVPVVIAADTQVDPPGVQPALVINEPKEPLIYQGDFSGASKSLSAGRYSSDQLGVGNDQLSSIKVPKGFRVTLYDGDAFEGRSITLTGDARASVLVENNFNNATSSILVEALPMVTVYEGDYGGVSARLLPGRYVGHDFGIGNDQLSSVRVPRGLTLTLYEDENLNGRKLVLTQDSGTDVLAEQGFNNETSSVLVEVVEKIVPTVTLFRDDFSGVSKKLAAGRYESAQLGIGNDALSSIQIPRGLQVTLYEHEQHQGRAMTLRGDANMNFFATNEFNDITSSVVIEQIFETEPIVTVYSDKFAGRSQSLTPGRYALKDITMGTDQISSARVPSGMRLILYEDDGFKGYSLTAERDIDLAVSRTFDNRASSIIVEDLFVPQVTPLPEETITPPVPPVVPVEPTPAQPAACEMNTTQFQNAYKLVESKGFMEEKMEAARLTTKDRCLSILQIRSIATLFMSEDQTLEFVKYAYDLSMEKREYYLLEDVFKYMSTRDEFNKFLKGK